MIKLVYLIKRRPDLTDDAFRAAWRRGHAALLEGFADELGARRYVMASRLDTPCETCFGHPRNLSSAAYDGVIEIWWDDLDAYQSGVGSAAEIAAVDALIDAEHRFIDFSRSAAFFAEETPAFGLRQKTAPRVSKAAVLKEASSPDPLERRADGFA